MRYHQGDRTIMQNHPYGKHLEIDRDIPSKDIEIDRDIQRKKALAKYRCLKKLKKSELSIEDTLFLENFEAAMHMLWGLGKCGNNHFF